MPVPNQGKKKFDVAEYEALPAEKRSEYIKNTYAGAAPSTTSVQQQAIDVEGQLKAKQPISQPKIEQLKKEFSLQAPQAPAVPATTQAPATPAAIPEKKKEEEKKGFDWASLLPALAPLATEALMSGGGTAGESLGISGKYLIEEEAKKEAKKSALESKLLDLQAKRDIAALKSKGKEKPLTVSNTLPYLDEQGKVRYALVEEALGKEKPAEQKKGLTFEEWAQREKMKQQFSLGKEARKEGIAAGRQFQTNLRMDENYKAYKAQLENSQKAIEWLSQGKNIADVGVKKVFAKGLFGDVGNIAVQEAADVAGSPSIYSRYLTLKAKFDAPGVQFSDQDRADMMEFAQMIRDSVPGKMKKLADKYASAEKEISGRDVSRIADSLTTDPQSGDVMVKIQIGKDVYEIPSRDYPSAVRKYKAKLYMGRK